MSTMLPFLNKVFLSVHSSNCIYALGEKKCYWWWDFVGDIYILYSALLGYS